MDFTPLVARKSQGWTECQSEGNPYRAWPNAIFAFQITCQATGNSTSFVILYKGLRRSGKPTNDPTDPRFNPMT